MALSFGRGKKGDTDAAAPNAASDAADKTPTGNAIIGNATNGATEEVLDESWFESAFNEEAANPSRPASAAARATAAPNPAYPAQQPATPESAVPESPASEDDFSIFAELESSPKATAASSFDMADGPETATTAAPSAPFMDIETTPFDSATVDTLAGEVPAKPKGGGIKKLLPIIGLLVVVGGGALFWQTQIDDGGDEGESVIPAATSPAPDTPAPPPPATTSPAATKAPATAIPDPKVKAQLKKLWDDGLKARKAGKNAEARKKWQEAVKLARSKPGYNQSADQIQDAINKLK